MKNQTGCLRTRFRNTLVRHKTDLKMSDFKASAPPYETMNDTSYAPMGKTLNDAEAVRFLHVFFRVFSSDVNHKYKRQIAS